MTMLTCEEVEALLPEFAMGVLDESERLAVAARLDDCPGCRAKLAAYQALTDDLARNVPRQRAPAALRATLVAAAKQDAGNSRQTESPLRRLRRWFGAPLLTPRLMLALLALVGLGTGLLSRLVPAAPSSDPSVFAQHIAARGANARKLNPVGPGQATNAWGQIKFNPDDFVAALEVGDLPEVPTDKNFQLWLVDANGKRDSGVVFAGSKDKRTLLVTSPRPMKTYIRFGISLEPAGGSPGPTGPGVLRSG